MKKIIDYLKSLNGLNDCAFINDYHKSELFRIILREEYANLGVFAALLRTHTLVVTHDSTFRQPCIPIVSKVGRNIVFPAVPFPELDMCNVVSSSPGFEAHEFLKSIIKVKSDEATLLIGFN